MASSPNVMAIIQAPIEVAQMREMQAPVKAPSPPLLMSTQQVLTKKIFQWATLLGRHTQQLIHQLRIKN